MEEDYTGQMGVSAGKEVDFEKHYIRKSQKREILCEAEICRHIYILYIWITMYIQYIETYINRSDDCLFIYLAESERKENTICKIHIFAYLILFQFFQGLAHFTAEEVKPPCS